MRRLDSREDRIEATYQEHGKIPCSMIQCQPEQVLLGLRGYSAQSRVEVRRASLHSLDLARGRDGAAG